MPAARWAVLAAAVLAGACTPLQMKPPETGSAGAGGAGTAGAGGAGTAGTGDPGAGGAGTAGAGGAGTAGAGGAGTAGAGGAGGTAGGGIGGGGTGGGGGGTIVEPLIAHWRFNEGSGTSVADSSGNGQTMTLSTSARWTTAGHEGAAYVFDGATDVARFTPQVGQAIYDYPTIPLTFSAWVRPDASAATREFATAVARTHEDYAFQDFWIGLVNGRPGCTIHSPEKQGPVAGAAAPAGVWTHIACTYGLEGLATLYVNGAYAASISTNQLLGPIPTAILVGASERSALEDFFPGAVDDVRIYNTTLTASEVLAIAR